MHTKTKGDITEAMVAAHLMENGFVILKPLGDNQRYDLVIDQNGIFSRIQCKTGKLKNGAVKFSASSTYIYNGVRNSRNYRNEIEYFGVYCPDNRVCYLVPVNDATTGETSLRIEPTRNNQKEGIRFANNYLLPHSSTG